MKLTTVTHVSLDGVMLEESRVTGKGVTVQTLRAAGRPEYAG